MEKILRLPYIGGAIVSLKIVLTTVIIMKVTSQTGQFHIPFDTQFALFIAAGFIAQIIDAALGMAYGVSCSTMLLGFGLSPAAASASVHTAEVFTTGVSGLSHIAMKNIDTKLFLRLVITGVVGAMLGAYLVSKVFDGKVIKPYVSAYLLVVGFVILYKAFRQKMEFEEIKRVPLLGFVGGMMDAIGGGGWGPIVTSNLIKRTFATSSNRYCKYGRILRHLFQHGRLFAVYPYSVLAGNCGSHHWRRCSRSPGRIPNQIHFPKGDADIGRIADSNHKLFQYLEVISLGVCVFAPSHKFLLCAQ